MKSYNELGRKVLEQGHLIPNDRTGVGTLTLFGEQLKFDLMDGFPLVSGSKKAFRWIFEEQMAFLNGITSNTHFENLGITIWDEWALKEDQKIKVKLSPNDIIDKLTDNIEQLLELCDRLEIGDELYAVASAFSAAFKSEAVAGISSSDKDAVRHQIFKALVNCRLTVVLSDGTEVKRQIEPKEMIELLEAVGVETFFYHYYAKRGDLGPIYGAQWRGWQGPNGERFDQIEQLVEDLKERPFSRRLIVSAWNPAVLPDEGKSHAENVIAGKQVLPPCHTFFQCHVRPATERDLTRFKEYFAKCGYELPEQMPDKVLDLQLYQRSADLVLGVPYNIAAYAFLNHLLAEYVGMIPGVFTHTFGNVHIYQNHIEKFRDEQLTRELRELPLLAFDKIAPKLWETVYEDVRLVGYNPHPRLDYPVAV